MNRTSAAQKNENQTAQDALFSFEIGIVPITKANNNDAKKTIDKDTKMGSLQLDSDRLLQELNQKQTKNYIETYPEYVLENVRKAISRENNINCRPDFRNLTDDFSDIFLMSQRDVGKFDASSHGRDV